MFAWAESDRRRVVDLARHHHKVRPLGDVEGIAGADFYVSHRVLPLFDLRADMDQHAAVGLNLLQSVDELLTFTRAGNALASGRGDSLVLNFADHVFTALSRRFAHRGPVQDRRVGIRFRREAAGALQDGAEMLAALNSITPRVHDLTGDVDGAADIGPAADLTNGKHIARLQQHVSIGFARQCAVDANVAVLKVHVVAVNHGVTCKVGRLLVGAALETAGQAQQVRCGHPFRKRILSRTQDLTIN